MVAFMSLASVSRLSLLDRKSTRLNSSHANHSYAVFCLKKKHEPQRTAGDRAARQKVGGRRRVAFDVDGVGALIHLARLQLFFFNATATTEIYTLSLHDALPI